MTDWMYAHSLPIDMHPAGCECGCRTLTEYKRVERELAELIRQLTDSFANDLVHVESGPPPEEPSARGWFEEYEKHLKDMLQWMKRIGGDE